MADIFTSLFGNQVPQQQRVPQQQMPGQGNGMVPGQNSGNPAPNGDPAAFAGTNNQQPQQQQGNQPQQQQSPADPMDGFKDLWDTPVDADGKPIAAQNDGPVFNVDRKKIGEFAAKNNFAGQIPPELMAKINAGGPDATNAMLQIMNKMVQRGFASSVETGSNLSETAVNKAVERALAKIPGMMNQRQLNDTLQQDNPAFAHSSVAPLVQVIANQFQQKNPNASPQEVAKMARDYMANAANVLSGKKPDTESTKGADGQDWSSFLE